MDTERAFTRRQPGVNPIALELERLAEQKALRTLGRTGGMLPRSEDRTATDAPMASPAELAAEAYARQAPAGSVGQPLETPLSSYQPGDPFPLFKYEPGQWGGLEEDEAYQLWADRLATEAARRGMFQR